MELDAQNLLLSENFGAFKFLSGTHELSASLMLDVYSEIFTIIVVYSCGSKCILLSFVFDFLAPAR